MHDVVVIGGGPAGSTAANLLAQAGHDVLVIEKETFPRFHIGESLLPCDLPIFARLGVDLGPGPFLLKQGAEFIDERTNEHTVYLFADGLEGTPKHAFQVERSKFDHSLLERAKAVGAAVCEGEKVTDLRFEDAHVELETSAGVHRARFCVDATGQDAFVARRRRSVEPLKGFGIAAVFCHFDGLAPDIVRELHETGNIKVLIIEEGWVWLIPLHGGRLSCGVVTRRQGVGPPLLDEVIESSAVMGRLTRGGTRTEARTIRNFSFKNVEPYGPRLACVGDASCFLDPVFSSGVSLAMLGAERLADTLSPALREGREADPALMAGVEREMAHGYQTIGSLVNAFYNTRIVQNLFFAIDPDPHIRSGLISVLAGDVWRDDNAFQKKLLSSPRRWWVK